MPGTMSAPRRLRCKNENGHIQSAHAFPASRVNSDLGVVVPAAAKAEDAGDDEHREEEDAGAAHSGRAARDRAADLGERQRDVVLPADVNRQVELDGVGAERTRAAEKASTMSACRWWQKSNAAAHLRGSRAIQVVVAAIRDGDRGGLLDGKGEGGSVVCNAMQSAS
jgi:hypothetical protein